MKFVPKTDFPISLGMRVDHTVLLATMVISVLTGMIFGILPALRASGEAPIAGADGRAICQSGGFAVTPEQALADGEDYELLFTAAPTARTPRHIGGVPVTRIGRMVRRRKGAPLVTLRGDEGDAPLVRKGWQHFS